MQQKLNKVRFIIGNHDVISEMPKCKALPPFDTLILDFLDCVSKRLMADTKTRAYPDVITFAFWCRRANILLEKETYQMVQYPGTMRLGRGTIFHIAPSNVPINYAYSMVAGLLAGNANVVRIPSKSFIQIDLVNQALQEILEEMPWMKSYLVLVQYDRDKEVNDYFSSICHVRVIWGGDRTILELRQSPLQPRATELTFADRDSLCVIGAANYLEKAEKEAGFVRNTANAFYNDTYLSDQNACTAPRFVVWLGTEEVVTRAKEIFWSALKVNVVQKYEMQPIQAVNKYDAFCRLAADYTVKYESTNIDNRLMRVKLKQLSPDLMEYKGDSGYFLEFTTEKLSDISILCGEKCQTASYVGIEQKDILSLFEMGIKGIDRIVPVGKTMDFNLRWDGYCLIECMSREISFD